MKTVFGVDEIHRLRVETAERYASMKPEDARRDRREQANETRRAIEKIRASRASQKPRQ